MSKALFILNLNNKLRWYYTRRIVNKRYISHYGSKSSNESERESSERLDRKEYPSVFEHLSICHNNLNWFSMSHTVILCHRAWLRHYYPFICGWKKVAWESCQRGRPAPPSRTSPWFPPMRLLCKAAPLPGGEYFAHLLFIYAFYIHGSRDCLVTRLNKILDREKYTLLVVPTDVILFVSVVYTSTTTFNTYFYIHMCI